MGAGRSDGLPESRWVAARAAAPMECGGLPPLWGVGWVPAPDSGSKLPHSIRWRGWKRPQLGMRRRSRCRRGRDFHVNARSALNSQRLARRASEASNPWVPRWVPMVCVTPDAFWIPDNRCAVSGMTAVLPRRHGNADLRHVGRQSLAAIRGRVLWRRSSWQKVGGSAAAGAIPRRRTHALRRQSCAGVLS
jgi:hypothetical protein